MELARPERQADRGDPLRAGPRFLSAEDLLEQVWDENADPFTNTVTVTIGRLRRKLGEPLAILTTPGVGYRIA
jgi:DNA-binding response OmpR family regulator